MEKRTQSPTEARSTTIADLFDKELKKISDRMEKVRNRRNGVYANGTINRKGQEMLHLKQRHAELINDRTAVLQMLLERPTQTYRIKIFFERKLDEIDLKIETTGHTNHRVIVGKGNVMGVPQQLSHLTTMRSDMLRVGNHVLDVLGLPHLIDGRETPRNNLL